MTIDFRRSPLAIPSLFLWALDCLQKLQPSSHGAHLMSISRVGDLDEGREGGGRLEVIHEAGQRPVLLAIHAQYSVLKCIRSFESHRDLQTHGFHVRVARTTWGCGMVCVPSFRPLWGLENGFTTHLVPVSHPSVPTRSA